MSGLTQLDLRQLYEWCRIPYGALWRVNDPALDPIWAQAGELGIPVLIHTADPLFFWEPVNERNFWNDVLYGE